MVLLSVILLSGCAWLNNDEKNMVIASPLPKINNRFSLTIAWSCLVGSGTSGYSSILHPAVWQDTRLFVADRYGIVKALDIDTGKEIWSINLSTYTHSPSPLRNNSLLLSGGLTVASNRVYIGSELAKVYMLSAEDGSIGWQTNVAGEVLSSPTVSNNMVLIYTNNGILQALNQSDGIIKWTIALNVPSFTLRGTSSPTTAFGNVIIGSNNGLVSLILIDNGQLVWQQQIGQLGGGTTAIASIHAIHATPVIVNDVIYVIAYNGKLAALALYSGQIIWSQDIGSATDLLVNSNRIYLVDQDDQVMALDSNDGKILWRQSELLHRSLTSPILYNGCIVVGDSKGYLHLINIDDGSITAQKKVNKAGLLSKPIVAGNKLIVQANNGKIYALTHHQDIL